MCSNSWNSSSNPKTSIQRKKNSISNSTNSDSIYFKLMARMIILHVRFSSRKKRHRLRRAAWQALVQQPRLNNRDAPVYSIRTTLGCSCTICITITTIPGLRVHRHRTGRPLTRSPHSRPALRVRQPAASAPCPAPRTPRCTRRTGDVAAGDISFSKYEI